QYWHFTNVAPGDHLITLVAEVSATVSPGDVLTNTVTCNYTDLGGNMMPGSSSSVSLTVVSSDYRIVINEIASLPNNNEWVEIANPTSNPVDLSGWRLQVFAVGAWRDLYVFPAGTTIGAWGSGSEYLVVTEAQLLRGLPDGGARVRLRSDAAVTIDATRYPSMSNGQTWSRFKHEDTGKPIDTNSQSDWYISNNNWIVPEGPTPGAPNDRKRPVINVEKSAVPAEVEPGDIITYTIWYNNTGDGNAKVVWVNDTLPTGVTYLSANPAPLSISGQNITWFFNTVVHDSTNFITMTSRLTDLTIPDGTILSNFVTLEYRDQLKRPMEPSSAWANVTCRRAHITVEKVADVAEAQAGDLITYTIYYNNTGSRNAGNVWINDTLPSGVTYISANPAPDSNDGLTYRWHFVDVTPGTHSITITVQVNLTTPSGIITNWAFLNYTASNGYKLEESSSAATVMIPEFDLWLALLFLPLAVSLRRRVCHYRK
ncbi:MAG: lamin tail domain-containing protein, partial [Candidatus Thermoplasmatota archaeon]